MSPRLNVTPYCCLQLEKANELLSEEEVWYVLSEMAQVKFFLRASFQCACVCAVPQQCLLSALSACLAIKCLLPSTCI